MSTLFPGLFLRLTKPAINVIVENHCQYKGKRFFMQKPNRWRQRHRGQYCRWTGPRELVLEFLSRSPGHLSAKEIYSEVQKIDQRIGLTTIYRTLDLLNRMGLINKLVLGDGQARYEYKPEDQHDHHHHLICTGCGQIIDYSEFEEEELDDVGNVVVLLVGVDVFRRLVDGADREGMRVSDFLDAAISDRVGKSFHECRPKIVRSET